MSTDWMGIPRDTLTELEAYDAMHAFIVAYWERSHRESDDIAVMLGSMERLEDGQPSDPAQWLDWCDAIDKMRTAHKPVEKPE